MFIPEEKIYLKDNIIIGVNGFQNNELQNFKNIMRNKIECNLKYTDIDDALLDLRIKYFGEKKKTNKNQKGMISKDWINKYLNDTPSVVIQIIDISTQIRQGGDFPLIFRDVMPKLGVFMSGFMDSKYILIIKNEEKSNKLNIDLQLKKAIITNVKYAKEKCIIIINDNKQLENIEFIGKLADIVRDEIKQYFKDKKNICHNKYEYNKTREIGLMIKYLIKLFALSSLTHVDNNINYSYLFKANLSIKKLDKKYYIFNNYLKDSKDESIENEFINQIISYFEIKNINDYVVYYLCMKNNMKEIEINKIIYSHLVYFNINNYFTKYYNNNEDTKFYIKYLFLLDCIWKLSWHKFRDNITNKIDNKNKIQEEKNNINFNNNVIDYFLFDILLRLYNFMIKETKFI